MKATARLILVLVVLGACGGSTSLRPGTTRPTTTTNTSLVVTTSSMPPLVSTTTLPTTSTQPTAPPDLTLDAVLSGPSAPWHSVAVASPLLQISGFVTPGSGVFLTVSSPPVRGDVVFAGPATVEDAYFHGEVQLVPGRSLVAIIATGLNGATTTLKLEARYEPDASVEFGFLRGVSATEIEADYAQWLTGADANQAAFEDGAIATVEEGVPNDYYIRNINPRLRTLPIADDVIVWLASPAEGSVATVPVALDEWLALFNKGVPWDYETDDVPDLQPPHFGYFGAGTVYAPYWLVILGGEVISIEQQYLP